MPSIRYLVWTLVVVGGKTVLVSPGWLPLVVYESKTLSARPALATVSPARNGTGTFPLRPSVTGPSVQLVFDPQCRQVSGFAWPVP